jgi:flagellar hook-basal body complex protein FliE
MAIEPIPGISTLNRVEEVRQRVDPSASGKGPSFTDTLKDAVRSVDDLQQQSEAAQVSWSQGENVDLHDVLIKIEEAEIAFKAMMEVRNKLIEAYHEVMRIGSGG